MNALVRMLVAGLLLVGAFDASAAAQATALAGRPFGVGSVQVPLAGPQAEWLWRTQAIRIEERGGRVFYPAIESSLLGSLVGGGELPRPQEVTLSFLFVGEAPLELVIYAPQPRRLVVFPQAASPRAFERALTRWWRDYHATIRRHDRSDDYSPLPHTYLASMLGRRLGMRTPLLSRVTLERGTELQETLSLLLGNEAYRDSVAVAMLEGNASQEAGSLPVPESIGWAVSTIDPLPDVAVEPIARRVPVDCLYIRFGSFPNYLWFSRLMRELGGEFGKLASLRGQDGRLNERLQYQLGLKESRLAEIFGSSVIADVALIGSDLYLADGAAMGVLFQAKNNAALSADLRHQQSTALNIERENGAVLREIEIGGRSVSFLSTPDNRLRSFYAHDGDFHLVTTSRDLAARFLATSQGAAVLADSPEFQRARRARPLERDDTIFAFFSSAFFQTLLSPQYQLELRRRLQAAAAIDLVRLARLAARAEGEPQASLDQLVAGGFLPEGFGRLADGSGPVLAQEDVFDSLRGARGTFKPIPDVVVRAMTPREAEQVRATIDYFESQWQQLDPLLVALRREPLSQDGRERIFVDANISPLAEEKYGWVLSLLGPPSTQWITPAPGDVISMQAMVTGGMLSPSIAPHHLFLGVQDLPPSGDVRPTGLLQSFQMLRSTPGYLGSWPKLGFLDMLPGGLGGHPHAVGYSSLPLGLWRWQGDGFSVLSFQPQVLEQVVPYLRPEETENPAQIRVHVGDLSQSQLAPWLNGLQHTRALQASVGNARLLHLLMQQFKVPAAEARQTAERLLQAELVCALGGDYQLAEEDGLLRWQSTAWPGDADQVPDDYQASLLRWFRGARLDLLKVEDRLTLHAELEMQRDPPAGSGLDLPLLDLLRGAGRSAGETP